MEMALIFAVMGWGMGAASLAIALYSHYKAQAELQARILEARTEILGTETRLESYINRKVDERAVDIHNNVMSDSFELLQNGMNDMREGGGPSGIAGFQQFR